MSADQQSLLLKFEGDAAGVQKAAADTRAAIASLRSSFASDASQMQKAGDSALASLESKLTGFVSQRVPLVGSAFADIAGHLRGLSNDAAKESPKLLAFNKTVEDLAGRSFGKSTSQISSFLVPFAKLGTQAERNTAAFQFFGNFTGKKLLPDLEKAATDLIALEKAGIGASASMAGMAGPVGLAVVAIVASIAAVGLLAKGLFDLAVSTANFQAQMQTMSQQLGISVETLSAFEILAKTTGSDLGSITSSLGIFQRKLQEAQDPTSRTAGLMKSLGIETENTEQALRQAITVVARMPEGFKQTALAIELFGRGGKSILAIIKEMGGDLDGAMVKFREMGILISTEDAKAANAFTGQLALLDFQMRALMATIGKELIPEFMKAAQELSAFIKENRQVLTVLVEWVPVVTSLSMYLGALRTVIQHLTVWSRAYEATGVGVQRIHEKLAFAVNIYRLGLGTALEALIALHREQGKETPGMGASTTAGAEGVKDTRLEKQSQEVDITTITNAAKAAAQISAALMQQNDEQFERGQKSRRQQILRTIELLKSGEAEQQKAIQDQMDPLEQKLIRARETGEVLLDQVDTEKRVTELRVQAAALRRELEMKTSAQRLSLDKEEKDERILNLEAVIAKAKQEAALEIKVTQEKVDAKTISELAGLAAKTVANEKSFAVEEAALKKELKLPALSLEEKRKINTRLGQLDVERRNARIDQESELRKIEAAALEEKLRAVETANSRELQLLSEKNELIIAQEEAKAAANLQTNEQAAQKSLQIRLQAIDRESEALGKEREAATKLADTKKGDEIEADLINQQEVLKTRKLRIQIEGDAAIDAARQKDLDNQRRYQDAYENLLEAGLRIDEEIARLRIDILRVSGASRLTILNAEFKSEKDDEDRHHDLVLKRLREDYDAAIKAGKTMRERLAALIQYHKDVDKENKRHDASEKEREAREKRQTAVEGNVLGGAADILSQNKGVIAATQGLKGVLRELASVGMEAFQQLGDAFGQMVSNWVLTGDAGSGALRKALASVLAQVAQTCAVYAVMNLAAAAMATTAWGAAILGGTPGQFLQAAAMFAAAAVVTGVAGRVVAGDSFKQGAPGGGGGGTGGSSGGGSGSGSSGSSASNQPQTINMGRQQVTVVIQLHGDIGSNALKTRVIDAVVQGINKDNHQQLRTAIQKVGS